MPNNSIKEIEARFLEVNKADFIAKLRNLGAIDRGEVLLQETIFYDPELKWLKERRFVRLRKSGDVVKLTYKHHATQTIDGAKEIEFKIDDMEKASLVLEEIGLVAYRHQEKYRHTFELNKIVVDIDTWPKIPTYVELEGESEEAIRGVAEKLGFDWSKAVFDDARMIIEKRYGVPVGTMRWFTFNKFE